MDTGKSGWIVGLVLAAGLVASSGMAAYYYNRAAAAGTAYAEARAEVETLRQELRVRQPMAPNVVLDYRVDAPPPEQRPEATLRVTDGDEPESGDRIRTLEDALQAKDRQIAALQNQATNRLSASTRRDSGSWLETLRTTDTNRYQEFMARREQQHQEVRDAFARQAAHLMETDATDASETEQAERQMMLQLVGETWKLAEQLYANTAGEDRWAVMQTMRQNLDTLRPMLDTERNRTFRQLGLESGYTPGDVDVFVDYVNEVIEATSVQPLYRAMRRGPGGSWRGGGGPPPGAPPPGGSPATGPGGR